MTACEIFIEQNFLYSELLFQQQSALQQLLRRLTART